MMAALMAACSIGSGPAEAGKRRVFRGTQYMTHEELVRRWESVKQSRAAEAARLRPFAAQPTTIRPLLYDFLESPRGEHARPKRMQSPLEARFAHFAVKVLDRETQLVAQHQVRTIGGLFRLDFLLIAPDGCRLGIECDGADFHHPVRDRWRDAALLGERAARDIVRIEGKDLHRRPWDVLYLIGRLYPAQFSARGLALLEQCASPTIRETSGLPDYVYYPPEVEIDDEAMFDPEDYPESPYPDDFFHLAIAGRSAHSLQSWRFRYDCLLREPETSLDEWVRREERAGGMGA